MPPISRVEQLNQLVRSLVTLGMAAGFIYGFLLEKIDAGLFAQMFGIIVTWWFATRSTDKRATDQTPPALPPSSGGPTP